MIDRADDHYALDVSRARDRLDWTPRHSLLDTLPAIAESLRGDPEGWYRENHLESPPPHPPQRP
jgi:nucleoside-diphosphate-sugar epimerase